MYCFLSILAFLESTVSLIRWSENLGNPEVWLDITELIKFCILGIFLGLYTYPKKLLPIIQHLVSRSGKILN